MCSEIPSIDDGADRLDVARDLAQGLRANEPPDNSGRLDTIKVVHLIEGQDLGQAAQPGLQMTWHQGDNRFGLLMTIGRLTTQAGGLDSAAFYLRLAMDEPHGSTTDGSRKWFLDLPSGPY